MSPACSEADPGTAVLEVLCKQLCSPAEHSLEGEAPNVDGITWAVGMVTWVLMGWNEEPLLELQKSSVLSEQEVPMPTSPLSATLEQRLVRLWNFTDSIGVFQSVSEK